MKRLIILITTSLLLVFCSLPAFAATLSVRADSWPPYNGDPAAATPGYMIEVLKEIFADQNISIDYKLMPWKRALNDVQAGTFDAVVGVDPEEAPELVFPKEAFGENLNGFYVKTGNPWRFTGVASLGSIRLGVIDGYSYSENVDHYIAGNRNGKQVFVASGDDALEKLLKMLQSGRIDAIVDNVNVVSLALREAGLESQIFFAGVNEQSRLPIYVAFSSHNPQAKAYAAAFDVSINRLRNNGKLKEILARYGLQDWK